MSTLAWIYVKTSYLSCCELKNQYFSERGRGSDDVLAAELLRGFAKQKIFHTFMANCL